MASKKEKDIDQVVKCLTSNVMSNFGDPFPITNLITEDELRAALEHFEFSPLSLITKSIFEDLEHLTADEYAAKYHKICFENYPQGPHQKDLHHPFKIKIAEPEYAYVPSKVCEICDRTGKDAVIHKVYSHLPPNAVVYFNYCEHHKKEDVLACFKEKQEKMLEVIKEIQSGK